MSNKKNKKVINTSILNEDNTTITEEAVEEIEAATEATDTVEETVEEVKEEVVDAPIEEDKVEEATPVEEVKEEVALEIPIAEAEVVNANDTRISEEALNKIIETPVDKPVTEPVAEEDPKVSAKAGNYLVIVSGHKDNLEQLASNITSNRKAKIESVDIDTDNDCIIIDKFDNMHAARKRQKELLGYGIRSIIKILF